jgi:hypothetical protein
MATVHERWITDADEGPSVVDLLIDGDLSGRQGRNRQIVALELALTAASYHFTADLADRCLRGILEDRQPMNERRVWLAAPYATPDMLHRCAEHGSGLLLLAAMKYGTMETVAIALSRQHLVPERWSAAITYLSGQRMIGLLGGDDETVGV